MTAMTRLRLDLVALAIRRRQYRLALTIAVMPSGWRLSKDEPMTAGRHHQ